jgi:hypothetical protein
VEAFPSSGLAVAVATDGTLYQTEVFAASHSPINASSESSATSVSPARLFVRKQQGRKGCAGESLGQETGAVVAGDMLGA